MRTTRTLVVLFALILIHILMSSLLSLHHEREIHSDSRNQPRRLLVSVSLSSSNEANLNGAIKDPQKALETSLRKAPPSLSNPTQNKQHQ
ncbi:hypothetical protein MANES_14G015100v8 [Manihot esculenta]|uniref:Uncharacterized protein n=1 Tax=Manihot esculenta TaxID=3983 RepID=A0A2C9UHU7_MANES|nr:hypothetical protein MANES_14G015100v8 [Manihot esculenta]